MNATTGLFDVDDPNADAIYRHLRAPDHKVHVRLRAKLETMWESSAPYMDSDFLRQFREQPEARYTEMHLVVRLLDAEKKLRRRDELTKAERDKGPDVAIPDDKRTIWIENISQSRGDDANADQIPDLPKDGSAQFAPHEQVALRITNGLATKHAQFEKYRASGLVKPDDICVVAISGAQFKAQSGTMDTIPLAVKAVYPFGEEYVTIDLETDEVTGEGRHYSPHIFRANGDVIPRDAFLSGLYPGISGLIWSRATIGNCDVQTNDLVFVHNKTAAQPFPERWMAWRGEYKVERENGGISLINLSLD